MVQAAEFNLFGKDKEINSLGFFHDVLSKMVEGGQEKLSSLKFSFPYSMGSTHAEF